MTTREHPQDGTESEFPSNADDSSASSLAIAKALFRQIRTRSKSCSRRTEQCHGSSFVEITESYIREAFSQLDRLMPGRWEFESDKRSILKYWQYRHLAKLSKAAATNPEIAALLNSPHVITPDILVLRQRELGAAMKANREIVADTIAAASSTKRVANPLLLLHAAISSRWTLRSDPAQNARSEALNLIRNRKGRLPHIVVVTGEPLPSRLASLALGTGDLDCVYHFALPELISGVEAIGSEDSSNLVRIMVEGKRLKDISDLPLDLAV